MAQPFNTEIAFNRRLSHDDSTARERRGSMSSVTKKDFDHANLSMVEADVTHLEMLDDTTEANTIDDIATSWFVWLVALTSSIAGSLFGYDTGIISAVLVYLGNDLDGRPVSSNEKELITSLCSGGAFVGAIIAGLTADRVRKPCTPFNLHQADDTLQYGRKMAIYVGCMLFTVGAILQAAAYSIAQMSVGRLVVGFGVGSAAMVVPLYIAEIAPTKVRGRLIGLNNMSITGGQVISYGIGAAFANVDNGWRYMVGLGAVPAILLACLLPFCPESPRQLVYHGKLEEAKRVIAKIYKGASGEQVRGKVALIARACEEAKELNENESRWSKIKQLHTVPANLRALVCACGLMVISQMSGQWEITWSMMNGRLTKTSRFQHPHVLQQHPVCSCRLFRSRGRWACCRRYQFPYDVGQHDDGRPVWPPPRPPRHSLGHVCWSSRRRGRLLLHSD